MSPWEKKREALLLSLCILAALTFFLVELRLEAMTQEEKGGPTTLFIPPATVLKRVALGYDRLASDFYWLRAIQYFGEGANARENYRWLYPIINLVTDMDPQFAYAYKFAGVTIPYDAASAEKANQILEKGIKSLPEVWQIPFYVGFNSFYFMRQYEKAAQYMSRASRLPGAPPFLAGLASRLYAEAQRPDMAIEFLVEMYNSVEDDLLRKELEKRIKEAVVERDITLLNVAVEKFLELKGRYPANLPELVAAGIINRLPAEPFGGRYYFNPDKKQVESTMVKERLRVYEVKK